MSVEGVSPHATSHSCNNLGEVEASVLDSSVIYSDFYKSTYFKGRQSSLSSYQVTSVSVYSGFNSSDKPHPSIKLSKDLM